MHDSLYALGIAAVVVLTVVRQSRPRPIGRDPRSTLLIPAVLVIAGISQGRLTDPHHPAVSAALLAAELAVGLLMGVGWSATARLWTEQDGSVWSRGTGRTALVWLGGLAARVGIVAVGALAGSHQGYGPLLITLGISLALRGFLLARRAAGMSAVPAPSYRDGVPQTSWKDRV